jgi:hypothetical protein
LWRRIRGLLGFYGPLLLGRVDLAQVVYTRVRLRIGASVDPIRDGDASQKANDHDDNHDLHQSETRVAIPYCSHAINWLRHK